MSAPNWLGDTASLPSHGPSGSVPSPGDPSLGFISTPTSTGSLDFNSLQVHHPQHRVQQGPASNGSPVPINPLYSTQSNIPTKRPRPLEDGSEGSPQIMEGALPNHRPPPSQATFQGYGPPMHSGAFAGNSPYGSIHQPPPANNVSPAMQNQQQQQYHSQPQQRLQTVSPSPFSPATQNFAPHVSPPQSESGSRVNTPHNNTPKYPSNTTFGTMNPTNYMGQNGPGPTAAAQPFRGNAPFEGAIPSDPRMRAGGSMGAGRGAPVPSPSHTPFPSGMQPPNQMSNTQMAQMRAQQAQQLHHPQQRQPNLHQLMQNIMQFNRQRNIQFEPQPLIIGTPINSAQLFFGVVRLGGSRKIAIDQQWSHVAMLLGFPPLQTMPAAVELQQYWQTNLAEFEIYHMQQQQFQNRQRGMVDPGKADGILQQFEQNTEHPAPPSNMSAHEPSTGRIRQGSGPPSAAYHTPVKQSTNNVAARHSVANGHSEPAKARSQAVAPTPGHHAKTSSIPSREDGINGPMYQGHTGATRSIKREDDVNRPERWVPRKMGLDSMYTPRANNFVLKPVIEPPIDYAEIIQDRERGKYGIELPLEPSWPCHHGALPVAQEGLRDSVDALLKFKLRGPLLEELGTIDIRAITLSIRSGLQAEVRYALDILAILSMKTPPPSLDQCDDLVEALVECADDQVDLLVEDAAEVSDVMHISSYEEILRSCKLESCDVQTLPEPTTMTYDLQKAVNKLLCITSILRNFAFAENSHRSLTDPLVLKMLVTVIRHLGTRSMLLQTYQNHLEFAKDVVVFLSLTAKSLNFSNKDEAQCVLYFLISFAPQTPSTTSDHDQPLFLSYVPALHRYLPYAVDSLAKILTREPNRSFCRTVFASDAGSSSSSDLLTHAFALAVSPIPEIGATDPTTTITYRTATMVQGLLAAEIMIGMINPSDSDLACKWLKAEDGFATRLLDTLVILIQKLGVQPDFTQARPGFPPHALLPEQLDPFGYTMLTNRGLLVIKKLVEKAKDANYVATLRNVLASKKNMLIVLGKPTMDADIVRQLCAFSVQTVP